ncbi:MAG TPA: response regulator, partial [Terriglobales bacterium]
MSTTASEPTLAGPHAMREKILFVDDEPAVLQGYQRLFHNEFEVQTAVGGKRGLTMLNTAGPFAVVVSDMRMPEMNGVEFLSHVRKTWPDSVRIVLTGQADLDAAMAAVNQGNIFRFLTKPCDREMLGKTLTAGVLQYRLVVAERELLEKTLKGTIQVLSEVLSLANPAAFGRATRLRRYMSHLVAELGLSKPWRFEVAALMSQLGCVAVAPET